ncbi:MAG: 3D domain-containing protein [Actinomycetota bacterium]|nr:3D domain-containing protein [Actinomycetota bacterium]
MRAVLTRPRARSALVGGALVVVLFPAVSGAGPGSSLGEQANRLQGTNANIQTRSQSAVLTLYALDSSLHRARARLAALDAQAATLARERELARTHLRIAKHSYSTAQLWLSARLRVLYERGDPDPLSVLLGASSMDDALTTLDNMKFSASADRFAIEQTRAARKRLAAFGRRLAARSASLERLRAEARATEASLAQARAERVAYLAQLAAERRYNRSRIAALENQAQAIDARAQQVALERTSQPVGSGSTGPTPVPGGMDGTRMLTVSATGYSIHGRTATGAPTGYGVVAVDPSVIPLGTRMTIPGYGEGVAADTGGAVRGATIDLWFPTAAQASAWGRRTVTITLH